MFYSSNLLTKRGPLGKLWFAAHHPSRINKAQIVQTSIKAAVGVSWRLLLACVGCVTLVLRRPHAPAQS